MVFHATAAFNLPWHRPLSLLPVFSLLLSSSFSLLPLLHFLLFTSSFSFSSPSSHLLPSPHFSLFPFFFLSFFLPPFLLSPSFLRILLSTFYLPLSLLLFSFSILLLFHPFPCPAMAWAQDGTRGLGPRWVHGGRQSGLAALPVSPRDRADALLLRADLEGDKRYVAVVRTASVASVTGLCSATRPATATDNTVFVGGAGSGGGGGGSQCAILAATAAAPGYFTGEPSSTSSIRCSAADGHRRAYGTSPGSGGRALAVEGAS